MKRHRLWTPAGAITLAMILTPACGGPESAGGAGDLTDAEVQQLVRLAYPYVAMYNVNNKSAVTAGGWNHFVADTQLKDHTLTDIARPNTHTFYITPALELRNEPNVLSFPAFDSEYVSLMITGYDHYVNIPMASRFGSFEEPERILVYSERTEGYDGSPVEGVDHLFEATGDFVTAVVRLMPHAAEPDRMARIAEQAQAVTLETLSEYRGEQAPESAPADMPPVGTTDADLFGDNLLEVLQFVVDHTTFDPGNADDQAALEMFARVGIEPGDTYDEADLQAALGPRLREVASEVQTEWLTAARDAAVMERLRTRMFQPKGKTDAETVLAVSILGPIGMPQEEAVYPPVGTADGEPMNALHDYVVRMSADEMPPAGAFWSLTLYDEQNGFFIPNDRKKYSVGLNGGMELDDDGGIEIWIAAEQPDGVPEENWLPISREDLGLNLTMRLYEPDLEAYEDWTPPVAEPTTSTTESTTDER